MRKTLLINALVFSITLAMVSAFQLSSSSAQGSFGAVEVFSGGAGFVKFFDRATGTMYTYNQDLTKCINVVELEELGKPGKITETTIEKPEGKMY